MRRSRLTALFGLVGLAGCSLLDLSSLDGEGTGAQGATLAAAQSATSSGPTAPDVSASSVASAGAVSTASGATSGSTSSGESYPEVVLADAPVAYFRMNDVGPTLFDEVTRTQRGTAYGGVGFEAAGAFEPESGTCIQMYDPPGHVEITDVADLEWPGDAPYSVECWINVAENDLVPLTVGRIVTREVDGAPAPSGWYLGATIPAVDADFADVLWTRRDELSADTTATATGVITLGFRHLVAVFDGASLHVYVDGEVAATALATGALAALGPIRIGSGPMFAAPFAGQIDEMAFYDYALDAAQVAHHFAAGTD